MRVYDLPACPACGDGVATTFNMGGDLDLKRCAECDHVYAPRYADPEDIYVDGYLSGGVGKFGLDIMDPRFQQLLAVVADRRLRLLERSIRPPGRLLDVGCGSGELLLAAQRRGWSVAGAEPVADSATFAREVRGLDVRTATLEESGLPERSFDVVCAMHVLEHMQDAAGFLRTLARWARPGGVVFVEVPNWRSLQRRATGFNWIGMRPLEHLSHFTPATLARTIQRVGLTKVKTSTPTYLWSQQTLQQALADLGLTRRMHALRFLGRNGTQFGEPAVMASRLGHGVLKTIGEVYGLARVGMVIDAIAVVP